MHCQFTNRRISTLMKHSKGIYNKCRYVKNNHTDFAVFYASFSERILKYIINCNFAMAYKNL